MASISNTPLRYPGGKAKLGPWLGELIKHNNLVGGTYVEPYAGGAGAAMYLLFNGLVDKIVINDADKAIYAMWYSILNNTDEFLSKLKDINIDMSNWYAQRDIINKPEQHTLLELGFAAFFLNRTNISGVIKGGVIGGKNQTGNYKMDARFKKDKLERIILKIAAFRERITVHNLDAEQFIDYIMPTLPDSTLVYFDPPYYVKGSQLYRNHYKHDDHAKIANKIKNINHAWLVTYDNCTQIQELYSDCASGSFALRYSASQQIKELATELIFYGNLSLKEMPKFAA